MIGIEQLHPKNHTLYVRVQVMLNQRARYEEICDIIGLVGPNRVNELCEWFIAYKTPKQLPTVVTKPVSSFRINADRYRPTTEEAKRFIAWRKQHEGARKALEAAGL